MVFVHRPLGLVQDRLPTLPSFPPAVRPQQRHGGTDPKVRYAVTTGSGCPPSTQGRLGTIAAASFASTGPHLIPYHSIPIPKARQQSTFSSLFLRTSSPCLLCVTGRHQRALTLRSPTM
eukprot:GGOE01027653.1.p6 GENE.GGOE01027653.1~~GGOE01027653.1.p6  ORF type:complete len:119 (+),score=13.07 GGOE01027653.1:521-877(+)